MDSMLGFTSMVVTYSISMLSPLLHKKCHITGRHVQALQWEYCMMVKWVIITGPPNGPVIFCWLVSVVVVCNPAGGQAGRRPGAWVVREPTLHGRPVVLRPIRATPSFRCIIGIIIIITIVNIITAINFTRNRTDNVSKCRRFSQPHLIRDAY